MENYALTLSGRVNRSLKRQQDNRHKQLDRFEASLKTATETQRQWRQRVQQKSLELEQARVRAS